ncbi:MAG: glycerol-3-phosphate dehydrogenase/oxidase [Actinobacteria bacterium]|nr:glycerol-3-phosphate dehydrogenase/oxidase [Actinomycetota bacterium]MCO5299122.1 glycerol-3-phosphate dehydrogenase/oxidase [Candidatus Nanopelagicales bacterium]HPE13052.1 glycerol-3-phosphate dehydrogenase/oxidase [Actinomycetota bacterium]HPJ18753.1 glycerol-3-phosphate dehydrogenase/oxidase [Actinomycetota bacterium]HPQ84567.1 glycerol-3-phosphate dehydrogenase/oxidase [Actinomycetota bacterium]
MGLREANIAQLDGGTFDVLIIGGGINGAVSAAALASRGARVAVIDRGDFADFTSMQSSNLVWGGFKYMENYELKLVRDLCMSRNHLIKAYPANLKEIRFMAALDENSPFKPWFAGLGAAGYWLIGNGFTKAPRVLTPEKIAENEPIVRTDNLLGGIEYSDAYIVDNDSRFVFGFIRSALNSGATCANYVSFDSATREGDRWRVQMTDVDTGVEFSAKTKVIINATGPFVDPINDAHGIRTKHKIVFSKGIHLIVPRLSEHERVLAFFDDTQRLFYVIPMGTRSVIGTTDDRVGDPHTDVTVGDRDFLLNQINERLDLQTPLSPRDIIATRSGVRPLVVEASNTTSDDTDWTSLSRKHAMEVDPARSWVTVFGGKLTDCVNIGNEVSAIVKKLGVPLTKDKKSWYGEPPKATREEYFRQARLMGLDRLTTRASFETLSTRLWRRYGLRAFAMLEALRDDPSMAQDVIQDADYVRVELFYAAKTEMITKLDDFLRRRSKIALVLDYDEIRGADGIHEACELLFGDDAQRRYDEYFTEERRAQLQEYRKASAAYR